MYLWEVRALDDAADALRIQDKMDMLDAMQLAQPASSKKELASMNRRIRELNRSLEALMYEPRAKKEGKVLNFWDAVKKAKAEGKKINV